MNSVRHIFLGIALLAATVLPSGAFAQATDKPITLPAEDFAKIAIAHGDYEYARLVLNALLEQDPKAIEANFLMAEIDVKEGHLPEAAERYRAILANHPELLRVRLELAAALYSLHDDESAEYHFRLVLAADIPDAVRTNVMLFLAAIHKRKRYALAFTASVAPDTNLNAGTSANEINLFGLPFKLDPTLQQKSGVGAVVAASGEYRVPLSEDLRMRSVASLWRADYPGGQFDDMIMRTEFGPQKIRNDWDASLLAVFTKRWYANDQYSEGFGPRIEAGYHGLQRWNLEMAAEYLKVNYHSLTPANGYYFTINFYPAFILSTTSYLQPILGLIHEDDEFERVLEHRLSPGPRLPPGGALGRHVLGAARIPAFPLRRRGSDFSDAASRPDGEDAIQRVQARLVSVRRQPDTLLHLHEQRLEPAHPRVHAEPV